MLIDMKPCQAPGCRRGIPKQRGPYAKYCSLSCLGKANVYATRRRRQAAGLRVTDRLGDLKKESQV